MEGAWPVKIRYAQRDKLSIDESQIDRREIRRKTFATTFSFLSPEYFLHCAPHRSLQQGHFAFRGRCEGTN